MQDKKITQLPILDSPQDGDLMYIVSNPSGNAISSAIRVDAIGGGGGGGGSSWPGTHIVKSCTGMCGMMFLTENGKVYASGSWAQWSWFAGITSENNTSPIWGFGDHLIRVPVPTTTRIVDIKISGQNGYLLDNEGNLYSAGYNGYGQIGVGSAGANVYPYKFIASGVEKLFGRDEGWSHLYPRYNWFFIRKTDGRIYGCGYGGTYGLGLGTTASKSAFTHIPALDPIAEDIIDIESFCHTSSSFAWTETKIYACGWNSSYDIGTGSTTHVHTFTDFTAIWNPEGYKIEKIDVTNYGTSYSTAIILSQQDNITIRVAGYNAQGQLGIVNGAGNTISYVTTPTVAFTNDEGYKDFKFEGQLTASLLTKEGNLYKTGYNGVGICGNGTYVNIKKFTRVYEEVDAILSTEVGTYNYETNSSSFIKLTNGKVKSCGYNGGGGAGQCGTGLIDSYILSYTDVLISRDVAINLKAVTTLDTSSSQRAFVAYTDDYKYLTVWGQNNAYQLFDNYTASVTMPTPISSHVPILKGYI
jgi:alpha-tubulin suppressor-like RCC1 family protein